MLQDPLTYSPEQRAELNRRLELVKDGGEFSAHPAGVTWAMTDRGTICMHLLDAQEADR